MPPHGNSIGAPRHVENILGLKTAEDFAAFQQAADRACNLVTFVPNTADGIHGEESPPS